MPLNEKRQVAEGDVGSLQCNDKKNSLQLPRDADGLDVIIWNGFRDLSRYFYITLSYASWDLFPTTIERPKTRGWGSPLNKPYRYMPPQRVGFLPCFDMKTGIDFAHFGLESGMVFEGTRECMSVFNVLMLNE